MICYTAIFGEYEELKTPKVVTPGWRYVCFTDQPFKSDVWEIIHVDAFLGPQRTARFYKIMFHRHITEEFSLWVDGSFTINIDLNSWWKSHFKAPFTCPSHPIRNCVYQEALACMKNKRGNVEEIRKHMNHYASIGVPARGGVISSGILLRQNTQEVQLLCEKWFNELQRFSTRDQISFARVSIGFKFYKYWWDYRKAQDFIFRTHYHRR